MLGRVSRAARRVLAPHHVQASAVLHTYNPQTVASVAAVGLGTAGIASGSASATGPDGKRISALSEAVSGVIAWGEKEQRRYVRLPAKVLAVISDDGVHLFEWTMFGVGAAKAHWPYEAYSARSVHYAGQIGARITLAGGLVAILTSRSNPLRRAARSAISAIVNNATP